MSRSLICLLLCYASTASAAWTQIDPPADPTGWAEITVSPAFADTFPLIRSLVASGGPGFYLQTNQFWLDFNFRLSFLMVHERLGFFVSSNINLATEAAAGVTAVTVERLGDVYAVGSPHNTFQNFRYTSSAGVREVTLSVGRVVPEPAALTFLAPALVYAATRRRRDPA